MSRFRGPRGLSVGTILLTLLCAAGCARPSGLQTGEDAAQPDQHQVPFHDGDGTPPRPGDSSAAQDNRLKPEADLPFHEPPNLPAGTLLTVRLKNPIFAENPGSNGTFDAVVDQPVVIDGNKMIPLGATVSGRVESAQASHQKRNRGYVRLTLRSIHLAGLNLPLQTSSLFVRGSARLTQFEQTQVRQGGTAAAVIQLEKGRRLVFRLTEPVFVAASRRAPADH